MKTPQKTEQKTNTAAARHAGLAAALAMLAVLAPAAARAATATDDLRLLRIDLGSAYSIEPQSINDHAQITMTARPTGTYTEYFILWSEDAGMVDFGASGNNSYAKSINNSGQIAWADYASPGGTRLWTPGTPNGTTGTTRQLSANHSPTDNPGARFLNNNGQVILSDATTVSLWTPGGAEGAGTTRILEGMYRANGLNDSGMVVGQSTSYQAAIWTDGEVTAINVNGSYNNALAVNSNGQVLVRSYVDGSYKSWVWTAGGEPIDIGNLGGSNPNGADTTAYDINDAGQVVGYSTGAEYTVEVFPEYTWTESQRAFLWTAEGGMKALNTLFADELLTWDDLVNGTTTSGWYMLAEATGINAHGEIVGRGFYWDGEQMLSGQAFALLLPVAVPEPATWAALAGLALLVWVAARRYRDARA
jgi:probable HAF family extracellular repeat protein